MGRGGMGRSGVERSGATFGLIRELEMRAPSGIRQALTQPPSATAPANTLSQRSSQQRRR
jgi:hypothetical protein